MTNVRRLPPPARASSFHAMALDRWRVAVARKMAGDEAGYLEGLADVRALDEQACAARVRQERLEEQIRERRGMAAAAEHVLELARMGREGT